MQGWCPGALRPMMSGDGLVVRVRPPGGRLSAAQAAGLAAAAREFGSGLIDLSARANVQLRGVREDGYRALVDALRALGLVDADATLEARRNIVVSPFATPAEDALAAALARALAAGPALPGKFGFAVDTGATRVLADVSADIRLERGAGGGVILRCDGAALGAPVAAGEAAARAVALARWFVDAGGVVHGRGRMAALVARGVLPGGAFSGSEAPVAAGVVPVPGLVVQGVLVGAAFGQLEAGTLGALAGLGDMRVTPWRMVLVEGLRALPDLPGLITDAEDPLRRVEACTGAPGCVQAHAPVRALARRLAAQVPDGKRLHVSGCAKGCAHPRRADVTVVATPAGFDLVRDGRAGDTPERRGMRAEDVSLAGEV